MKRQWLIGGSFAAAAVGVMAGILTAGPLDPPTGEISSSFKTIFEVEPRTPINSTTTPGDSDSAFRIGKPGSYYLVGNITGVAGKHGIEIATDGVTIDLNGFTLAGVPGAGDGITIDISTRKYIRIHDGHVRNWPSTGIDLAQGDLNSEGSIIERVQVNGCSSGILAGKDSVIRACIATANTASGIATRDRSLVESCKASGNTFGIAVGTDSVVRNCTSSDNSADGISTQPGCIVESCSAESNGAQGINAGSINIVRACVARSNGGAGIAVSGGSTVESCAAANNTFHGISSFSNLSTIRGNNCEGNGNGTNGGSGIQVIGADNVIEANHCSSNDKGIRVTSAGNFITRNHCTGNTALNWDVVASNRILVVNASPAGAITGNSGGTSPGSTDPNANYTY